jgi:hypothetical protein
MVKIVDGFACPYCHTSYETEDDAEECAQECVEIEEVEEVVMFKCEVCLRCHDREPMAIRCETGHPNWEEILERKESEARLKRAQNHPAQMRLI